MSALIKRIISTTKAPAAIGPYSQAVVIERTVYVSGQLGMDPVSGQLVEGGVQAQTRQALVNMGEILKTAGCGYENVVKTTVLLADMNDFNAVNAVYKQCECHGSNFLLSHGNEVVLSPQSRSLCCLLGSLLALTLLKNNLTHSYFTISLK
uniref:Uncharacterized protein n=1 Tax=Mola mola TaxID=94237 RepID=A0A3Q4BRV7_MOLML